MKVRATSSRLRIAALMSRDGEENAFRGLMKRLVEGVSVRDLLKR